MKQIYTKTGDNGTTSLRDGVRVAKDDPRISANGQIDQLNSIPASCTLPTYRSNWKMPLTGSTTKAALWFLAAGQLLLRSSIWRARRPALWSAPCGL